MKSLVVLSNHFWIVIMSNVFETISNFIKTQQRVLDCGCGDGTLLSTLITQKKIIGYGIDYDSDNVKACISKGVSVFQGDISDGLKELPDNSFDVVILSQTLQQIQNPIELIKEMCRVGKQAIVTFPNFAHWKCRWRLFRGYIPESRALPYSWYDTPNIRVISIRSFKKICKQEKIAILNEASFSRDKEKKSSLFSNLLAEQALFVLSQTS